MEKVNLTKQKELTNQKDLTKQKGFTLIELAFVLIVMAIITAFTTKAYLWQKAFEREEARADKTIQEIIQISEALSGWRFDEGSWAGLANNCVNTITILTNATPTAYLRYIDTVSPYDTDYVTSCDANNFTIEVKSNKDYAQYIRTKLAGTKVKAPPDDDTTITSIPNPTHLADFLPLAGGLMSGDIDMDDNAISNASDVEALNIELNGQDIKLGIGKFVSMGSKAFDSLTATINKPNCNQGARLGTPKIILRLHGFETEQGSINGIRDVRWSAKFISINTTKWQLETTGLDAITGVAETFCDYGNWNR
jgi:prepilin-type N-terminal cleavage/methylation domain-containing protein